MKTITEMAREAGAAVGSPAPGAPEIIFPQCLDVQRFAELVRADEREACAKVCDEFMFRPSKNPDEAELAGIRLGSRFCAAAIRARGNT